MASSSKRQTTMAKIAREQAVREKRARKQEKREDKKQAAVGFDTEMLRYSVGWTGGRRSSR